MGFALKDGKRLLAIALVSCAALLYEVALTRLLSVVLWYHFAFLAIALAMLGLGAPGVWFSLRQPAPGALRTALLGAGLAIPASVAAICKIGNTLALVVGAALVVFLLLGAAVFLLLQQAPERAVGPMYGADLLGAAAGAAAVVPLMDRVPTPALVAAAGFLPLAATALLDGAGRARVALLLGAALFVTLAWGEPYRLRYSKDYEEPDVLYERWTPTARLTVFRRLFFQRDPREGFGWGMGSRFTPTAVDQMWIEQDGSYGTPVTRFAGATDVLDHIFFDVASLGYQFRQPRRVCIIGAGGGRDVLAALASGARDVDAVEINPHMVDIVDRRLGAFSGRPYRRPGVRAVIAEGRSFLARGGRPYDLIQIPLVDSAAATTAGAFALAENYLYTAEAMQLYWRRIEPAGVLSVSRWMRGRGALEMPRLVLLAREALHASGVARPERHMAVVQGGALGTLLVSRAPLSASDIAALDRVASDRGFVRHWPAHAATPPNSLPARALREGDAWASGAGLDLAPPTDDRPFFFQPVRLLGGLDRRSASAFTVNERSVVLLRHLLLAVGALALVLFFAPFVARRGTSRRTGLARGTAYFAAIGIGFMLVEAPWIQRGILHLGHPSYATTVVLGLLLLAAGLGSIAAGRAMPSSVRRCALVLPAALAVTNLLVPWAFRVTIGSAFPARLGVCALLIAPCGFIMGFAFPSGMMRFGDAHKPWFWAVNGAGGVLATVASVALSIELGFAAVSSIGVAAYLAAALLLRGEPA